MRSCWRRRPTSPAARVEQIEPFEDWLAHDMLAGPGDRPEATFVALAGAEVIGYAKFSSHLGPAQDGAPRPHRRQACMARPGRRSRAESDADRVGGGERL